MQPGYIAIIISISTLIISGLTLWISFKNRRNNLRENIYNRQLDIFQKLFSLIIDLEDLIDDWRVIRHETANLREFEIHKELNDINEQIEIVQTKLGTELSKAQLLLPEDVSKAFFELEKYFFGINRTSFTWKEDPRNIEANKLSDQIFKLEDSIRKYIGLEKLSQENRSLVKSARENM